MVANLADNSTSLSRLFPSEKLLLFRIKRRICNLILAELLKLTLPLCTSLQVIGIDKFQNSINTIEGDFIEGTLVYISDIS